MEQFVHRLTHNIDQFLHSSYFPLISFILTILAIALAYIFYRKSRKVIKLNYYLKSYALIENSVSQFPNLKILYNEAT
jgi:hypothetical protein